MFFRLRTPLPTSSHLPSARATPCNTVRLRLRLTTRPFFLGVEDCCCFLLMLSLSLSLSLLVGCLVMDSILNVKDSSWLTHRKNTTRSLVEQTYSLARGQSLIRSKDGAFRSLIDSIYSGLTLRIQSTTVCGWIREDRGGWTIPPSPITSSLGLVDVEPDLVVLGVGNRLITLSGGDDHRLARLARTLLLGEIHLDGQKVPVALHLHVLHVFFLCVGQLPVCDVLVCGWTISPGR